MAQRGLCGTCGTHTRGMRHAAGETQQKVERKLSAKCECAFVILADSNQAEPELRAEELAGRPRADASYALIETARCGMSNIMLSLVMTARAA